LTGANCPLTHELSILIGHRKKENQKKKNRTRKKKKKAQDQWKREGSQRETTRKKGEIITANVVDPEY